ncbi:MAG: nucleotide sugar dehydrogenase, partial [Candidatus Izemoplasmatales bacterium]
RKSIGCVGYGCVNKAVAAGFRKHNEIFLFDEPKNLGSIEEVSKCDYIFVAVPTPMKEAMGGMGIDLSIIDKVIEELAKKVDKGCQIVIVKSTIVPGTMSNYANKYPNVRFVYNPEFLTEKNSIYDFQHQDRIIIGGNRGKDAYEVGTLYRNAFPDTPILYTGLNEAEMIKYASNCYLATRITFANEIYRICKTFDIDYDKVKEGLGMDKRIGHSHLNVPGPDEQYGFGGSCLPKDLDALITKCESVGYTPELLKTVWNSNLRHRTKYDWKDMPKAVSMENVCQKFA